MSKPNFKTTSNIGIEIKHFHCPACERKLYEMVDHEIEQCVHCGQEFQEEMSGDYEPEKYILLVDPYTGVPFIFEDNAECESCCGEGGITAENFGDVFSFECPDCKGTGVVCSQGPGGVA